MQSIVLCSSSTSTNAATEFTSKSFEINTFEHAKKVPFICLTNNNELYELQSVETSKFTSWFINQRVCSRSDIFLMNKYDLRFLLLPYLEKSGTRYSPIDQIIQSSSSSNSSSGSDQLQQHEYLKSLLPFLQNIQQHYNMAEMCDVNDKFDDMILFRYNEEKVMSWLKAKINKIESCLAKHRQLTQSSSGTSKNPLMSSTFNFAAASTVSQVASAPAEISSHVNTESVHDGLNTSSTSVDVQRIDTIQAIQVLTDYLTTEMTKKLLLHLNITEDELLQKSSSSIGAGDGSYNADNNKRKVATTDWELELEIEREMGTYKAAVVNPIHSSAAAGTITTGNSNNTSSKQSKSSSANATVSKNNNSKQQQQQSKAASGTKSIQSFFGSGGKVGGGAMKKK